MQIVDYNTFVKMPEGTVFAPYEPCRFLDGITIKIDKGERYEGQWYFDGVMDLMPNILIEHHIGNVDTELSTYDGDSMIIVNTKCLLFLTNTKYAE